jgi:pimeloyl-ACP methyl ester carboxylesterase
LRYADIGILGFSLGAAITINTVSRNRAGIRSLMLVSAPSAFEDIEFKWWTPEAIRGGWQGFEAGVGCRPGNPLIEKERPIDRVAALAGLPVYFVHGTRDKIVGVEHSRRLFAAACEPKEFTIVPGGSHAQTLFSDCPERFLRLVILWRANVIHYV